MMTRSVTSVALALLLLACADEPSATAPCSTVGASGEGGQGGSVPPDCAPGQIVGPDGACMAVGIQGCAEVFIEEDGLCHPRMDKCPAGTFAAPLLGCVPIDGPDGCGTGTWGHIADGPDTVWVDPAYAGGAGVGTQAQPFTTIADALAAVPAAGRVALAAGDYDEPVYVAKPVEIVGRCASLVTISGTQPTSYYLTGMGMEDVILLVHGADGVVIRSVGISGGGYGVIAVSATLMLQDVHIHEATASGVLCREGADVTVDRCLIEHTHAPAGAQFGGSGMVAFGSAHLSVSHSALYGNRALGVRAESNSTVLALGLLVESMLPSLVYGNVGEGFNAWDGGHIEASSSALVDCCGQGIFANVAELELTDSVLELTRGCSSGDEEALGAQVGEDAWVRLTGCAILDNGVGVMATDATLEARGNLVRGHAMEGVKVGFGQATLVDNAVVHNEWAGAVCFDTAPGLLIDSNLFEANGTATPNQFVGSCDGLGIYTTEDALLRNNAAVENFGTGIKVGRATAFVQDNLVEATRSTDQLYDRTGEGLTLALAGTAADVEGLAAVGNATRGVWLSGAERAAIRRSLITGTQPRPFDGELGCGAVVEGVGDALFEDVMITDSHLAAVLVQSSSSRLRDCRLADTVEGSFTGHVCPTKPCPWNKATVHHNIADGLIAASSMVQVSDVRISGCSRAGALFHASSGTIENVRSTDNGFGLVLQGSPLPDVADSCLFHPNIEQDVLTDSELAIPDASSELPQGQRREPGPGTRAATARRRSGQHHRRARLPDAGISWSPCPLASRRSSRQGSPCCSRWCHRRAAARGRTTSMRSRSTRTGAPRLMRSQTTIGAPPTFSTALARRRASRSATASARFPPGTSTGGP